MAEPSTERRREAFRDFARALKDVGIEPRTVEVSMATDDWSKLAHAIGSKIEGEQIEIGGVRYFARFGKR
jgi:hypothetical protein